VSDRQRVITLLQALDREEIAAILGTDTATIRDVIAGTGSLPASGGGGSNVVHATDVPDQTMTILDPGQPQDVTALWRIDGPGLWSVAMWYEIKPFDDNDYAGIGLLADTDLGLGVLGSPGGPDARAFTGPGEILAGGWIRQHAGSAFPEILMPSQWREYRVQLTGWHYNELDPGDTTQPVLGDVQIRNVRAVAVRLDA
jgi:hypothetical protein